jgi:predicted ATPase
MPFVWWPVIGRSAALQQLRDFRTYRAITLTGPGGIGKTTLALEPPLDVPGLNGKDSDNVLGHSAVQPFTARAMAVDSDFSPHGENLRAMADICRRLDGIPLGANPPQTCLKSSRYRR